MFVLLFLEVIILIKVQIKVPITLEQACVTLSMGQVDFSLEKWLISTSLGKTTKS